MKVREVITYKNYFEDFFKERNRKEQDKIIKVLDILEQVERVPSTYLKYIEGTNGLFEVRVQSGKTYCEYSVASMVTKWWFFSVDSKRKHRKLHRAKLHEQREL